MSLSDLATKGLCGLCKEVSLSVLPRLYMEEIMLELGRRNIDVRGEGVSKDDLVTILYELMTLEYREIDKTHEIQVEGTALSGDPLSALPQEESEEIHVESVVPSAEPLDAAQGQEIHVDSAEEAVNQLQPQGADNIHEVQTTLVDTSGSCSFRYITTTDMETTGDETPAVEGANIQELENLMETDTDMVSVDPTAAQQSTSTLAKPPQLTVDQVIACTSTDRGLSENEVRYVAVRPSTIMNLAPPEQPVPVTVVPVVTLAIPSARSGQGAEGNVGMMNRECEGDATTEEGMAADSDSNENISQEDKEAAEDLVSLSIPANEESSSQAVLKEEDQAAASPSESSSKVKNKIPVRDRKTRRYPCPHCSEVYYMKHHMDVHIRRKHTGEKPYMCDRCGMRFFEKPKMEDHIRTHTGEKPFKCNVCGRGFKDYSNLNTHRRLHTGVRPYKCKYCSYAANVSGDLQKHERTHTGERPYVCETCGRAFADKSAWRRHNKIHTGEKPYRCFCGYSTNRKCNFMTHAKKHPGVTILEGQPDGEEVVFEAIL